MLKTSILLADAHLLLREGLKAVLKCESTFTVVGEVNNSPALIKEVIKLKPDIVVIDYHSPGYFSIEDIAHIYKLSSNTTVLILTTNYNKNDIIKVLEYGVIHYILKKCEKSELLAAIYAASKKERYMCSNVVNAIVDKHINNIETCEGVTLSPREIEIIQLIAEGNTNNSIAKRLYLSAHTISTHRKNILKKFGLNKSSELVMHAIRNGIISSNLKT